MSNPTSPRMAVDEAAYQVDRDRVIRAIRTLQAMVGLLLLLALGMSYALYQVDVRADRSLGEINQIRNDLQQVFQRNLPQIIEINDGLAEALPKAEKLNEALKAGGELDQRISEGISRAESRIPAAMESYMRRQLPQLLAEAERHAREKLEKR
ncbi:MAG: hypothetical protein HY650_08070 [Acidobacteria bacterium]|nr:hypothetical protein [Acidobacteriota bacterium]